MIIIISSYLELDMLNEFAFQVAVTTFFVKSLNFGVL